MHNKAPLKITLLGKFEVSQGSTLLANFRHRKSLALLAYLAMNGQTHSRESLAGLLWGQVSDVNALGGLRKVLSELRSTIGPYLLEQGRQVAFNHALPHQIDALDFEQGLFDVHNLKAENLNAEKSAVLDHIVEQYQGDFLAGFYIKRAPAFEDWVILTRERLRLAALDGLYLLGKAAYRHSDYPASIRYTRRLLDLEPCHEEAHRQLMSLLALSGQREAALDQYQHCKNILKKTYSITPQAETTDLYIRIRQETGETKAGIHSLPMPSTPLIGRQADLDVLRTHLLDPQCHLLTIFGPGGSGKTHLALGLAADILERDADLYPDGIVFVPLSALRSIEALPSAIAYQLGFQFHKEASPTQQLWEYLANSCILLILDNFEHLIKRSQPVNEQVNESLLAQIIQHAPNVKILVTSRVRLNLKVERIYLLKGIEYPTVEIKSPIHEISPAVDLFIQTAQRITPDFQVDQATIAAIGKICRQLQGLPLGIVLAAGWSNLLSTQEIANQLLNKNGFALLENDTNDFPVRQRSLRAVLEYSWELLAPDERFALANLTTFRGTFSLEAAQQITGASFSDLRTLIDHSLLNRTSNGRYEVHEFTRQFAYQKLNAPDKIFVQQWNYYAARLKTWAAEIKSARQVSAIEALDLEIDNIRAAWDRAVKADYQSFLDQAIEGMALYYNWRHRFPEGLEVCQSLIECTSRCDNASYSTQLLLAKAYAWMGNFSSLNYAEIPLRKSLATLDKIRSCTSDPERLAVRAFVCRELASVIAQTGKNVEAKQLFHESISIGEVLRDRWMLASALNGLASILWDESEYQQAKELLTRSLAIQREIGDRRGMASSLNWLGMNMLFQGDNGGEQFLREGVAIYAELGEHMRVIEGIQLAAIALMTLGKFEEARSLMEEMGMIHGSAALRYDSTQSILTTALVHLGHYEEARKHAAISLEQAQQRGSPYVLAVAYIACGWIALMDHEDTHAYNLFQQSAKICKQHNLKDLHTWALSAQGFAADRLGNCLAAKQTFINALQISQATQTFVGMIFCAAFSLPLVRKFGSEELILQLHTALLQIPMVEKSVFLKAIIGQQMETVSNQLSLDIIEREKSQRESLGLDEVITSILNLLTKASE